VDLGHVKTKYAGGKMDWVGGSQPPGARFNVGDRVAVTGPGVHRGKQGSIIQVLDHRGDFVYRYQVRFDDETLATFFGFELDLMKPWFRTKTG